MFVLSFSGYYEIKAGCSLEGTTNVPFQMEIRLRNGATGENIAFSWDDQNINDRTTLSIEW